MKNYFLLFCLALSFSIFADKLTEPHIIPRPLELAVHDDQYSIASSTKIYYQKGFRSEAIFLAKAIRKSTGKKLKLVKGKGKGIQFLKKTGYVKEAYALNANSKGIIIEASHPTGAFYGVQTLLQSLPNKVAAGKKYQGKLIVPAMKVKDQPRFPWRAFMLDESRHFKGMKVVKSLLDQMASLKMNVFHWHLTDDQGWRVEIKKYPKLTTVGSKRKDTETITWGSGQSTGEPHSGFYTQKELKEIVAYAKKRHITIVPEIGMPGHAMAAIAAYPRLGTKKEQIEVWAKFGKAYHTFDPSDEFTYKFMSDVLDEVFAIFPSKVVHIGGDEVRFDHWKESKNVQALMKRKGLKTMADVQLYFTNRIGAIVQSKGRNIMGWNEIVGDDLHGFLQGGQTASAAKLDKDTVVHFWKGSAHLAKKAIKRGHTIVNSWHSFTYLDYGYGSISLGKAYNFNPVFDGLTPEEKTRIIGSGCQMWGEWIPKVSDLHRQVFPRIAAYAETGWTALDRKDFKNFKTRMVEQEKRWDLVGIDYAKNQINQLSAADFFNHVKVGSWDPKVTANKKINLDVSSQIQGKGSYEIVFLYKKGSHALDIRSVSLYANGKEISKDKHAGFSGGRLKKVTYQLNVKKHDAATKYSIKAIVAGSGGNDSYGEIKIIAK